MWSRRRWWYKRSSRNRVRQCGQTAAAAVTAVIGVRIRRVTERPRRRRAVRAVFPRRELELLSVVIRKPLVSIFQVAGCVRIFFFCLTFTNVKKKRQYKTPRSAREKSSITRTSKLMPLVLEQLVSSNTSIEHRVPALPPQLALLRTKSLRRQTRGPQLMVFIDP
jgi:hypothetical protein